MGIDKTYAKAYAKAAIAAGQKLPTSGKVFLTVMDKDKDAVVPIAKKLKVWTHLCQTFPRLPGSFCSDQSCLSAAETEVNHGVIKSRTCLLSHFHLKRMRFIQTFL